MSVGEPTIDMQHQKLLKQVNTVIETMVFGAHSDEVTEALKFFEQYTNEHLSYEESYMERLGYADLAHHKQKHQDFRKTYEAFKEKVQAGKTPDAVLVQMEQFLGTWWIEHIGYEDQKYHATLGGR